MLVRAHRRLLSAPVTHLVAFGFMSGPKLGKRLFSADLSHSKHRG